MYDINPHLKIIKENSKIFAELNNKKFQITDDILLILKIISESLDPVQISKEYNIPLKVINYLIEQALEKNLIIKKEPLIKRETDKYPLKLENYNKNFLSPEIFVLQWHITNKCDLNCKHCYDRSKRKDVTIENAIKIMKNFFRFSFKYSVFPQITFTGGNPFLHKDFIEIYKKASEMGFIIGILGNPVNEEKLVKIIKIQKPSFYQVSLEGLENYNDFIRGRGHFRRTIEFLKLLKKFEIFSNVMLTLNRDNFNQVFDLIDKLDGLTDSFTFNRLALFGSGANLKSISKKDYIEFLEKYLEIAKEKDFVRLKDNLINILLYKNENKIFGGCTGFGCGAGFNFVAVLSDGEVHACRKFPSYIGNILENTLENIYFSEFAENYRMPPEECKNCPINRVCRGCLAVIQSFNKDIAKNRDPYCFFW